MGMVTKYPNKSLENELSATQMKIKSRYSTIKVIGVTASLIILAAVFLFNSMQNSSHEDYRNSNFLKFWVAGHMVLTGQNPYDSTQWYNEHLKLGATQVPDKIFLYPLPQAYFLVPLALIPIAESFIIWGIISQAIMAATCFVLLNQFAKTERNRLFYPLVVFLLFFGPIYLSLQVGSIGVIALAVLIVTILLLERKKLLLAGIVLSVLILKPSQGLPILFLGGCWFLFKQAWKVIIGMSAGGLILLLSGLIVDSHWIQEFLNNSQAVSDRTLGLQSNIYSFAYLSCNKDINCMEITGTIGLTIVLGLGAYYLWLNRERLTTWEAVNIIVPLGFVSTIYLWSYDQLLYIFPIVWITAELVNKTKSYLVPFFFLICLDTLSFIALAMQAKTHEDLLSITTTILIFGLCLWLFQLKNHHPIDKPIPAA